MTLPIRPLLYVPQNLSRPLAGDLRRAGIPRETAQGKVDFHALRTTYINLLYAHGATPPETRDMARHKTATLTLEVYGRSDERRHRELVQAITAVILPATACAPGVHAQVVGLDYGPEDQGSRAQDTPLHMRQSLRAICQPSPPVAVASGRGPVDTV